MAVTYGFFNSLNGDRLYNADQMSEYFEGLITNGVYESVGNALQVLAGTGMQVTVGSGRAIINCKWLRLDSAQTLEINTAHVTLHRYTAVCAHLDIANRRMDLVTVDGENASTPTKPIPANTTTDVYLVLAYVYVGAGVTAITQGNITDTRADTDVCGWVTGMIEQVDTSKLFLQWQNAYEQYYADMLDWQATTKQRFDAWFSALTEQLNVNTYIEDYSKIVTLAGTQQVISIDMAGYTYASDDVIQVFINGLLANSGADYTLDTSSATPTVTPIATASGTEVQIIVYKSKIGFEG